MKYGEALTILSDIITPSMSVTELKRRLRSKFKHSDIEKQKAIQTIMKRLVVK